MAPALHVERPDGLRHFSLLRHGQFGIDRNGDGFIGGPLRLREVPCFVTEIAEALLQMEWNRVVDFRTRDATEFF
jgi:hypothetical protein